MVKYLKELLKNYCYKSNSTKKFISKKQLENETKKDKNNKDLVKGKIEDKIL